jgi:hypothetical protein
MNNQELLAKSMSESELQANIIAMAHCLDRLVHAERRARIVRADGSVYHETPIQGDAGFFDLVLMDEHRIILAELKSETGTLSDSQKEWQRVAKLAHIKRVVCVWRPRDWVRGTIERIFTRKEV